MNICPQIAPFWDVFECFAANCLQLAAKRSKINQKGTDCDVLGVFLCGLLPITCNWQQNAQNHSQMPNFWSTTPKNFENALKPWNWQPNVDSCSLHSEARRHSLFSNFRHAPIRHPPRGIQVPFPHCQRQSELGGISLLTNVSPCMNPPSTKKHSSTFSSFQTPH